jgi:hypothetical protein
MFYFVFLFGFASLILLLLQYIFNFNFPGFYIDFLLTTLNSFKTTWLRSRLQVVAPRSEDEKDHDSDVSRDLLALLRKINEKLEKDVTHSADFSKRDSVPGEQVVNKQKPLFRWYENTHRGLDWTRPLPESRPSTPSHDEENLD